MHSAITSENREAAGQRLVTLAHEIWANSFDKDGRPLLGGGLSGIGSRRSPQEIEIFNLFVADGESEVFAGAMIDFMRRPCTQKGDWTLVKGGVSIVDYMDQLVTEGV